jgi:hypothetical protein
VERADEAVNDEIRRIVEAFSRNYDRHG